MRDESEQPGEQPPGESTNTEETAPTAGSAEGGDQDKGATGRSRKTGDPEPPGNGGSTGY